MADNELDIAFLHSIITDLSSVSEDGSNNDGESGGNAIDCSDVSTLPVKRKRGRPRKVVVEPAEVVCKLPKQRMLRQDIRRSYSLMFINALNSCDFSIIIGFLDTFCVPHAHQTTYFKREVDLISESRHGLADMARFWCTNMQFLPDAVLETCRCYIDMSPEHNGNRIVAHFRGRATNIYDVEFPGFSLTVPHAAPFQACAGIQAFLQSGLGTKRQRTDDSCDSRQAPEETSGRPHITSQVRSVMEFVTSTFRKLPLKSVPKSMGGEFTLVLYVNDEKMITGLEMMGNHI